MSSSALHNRFKQLFTCVALVAANQSFAIAPMKAPAAAEPTMIPATPKEIDQIDLISQVTKPALHTAHINVLGYKKNIGQTKAGASLIFLETVQHTHQMIVGYSAAGCREAFKDLLQTIPNANQTQLIQMVLSCNSQQDGMLYRFTLTPSTTANKKADILIERANPKNDIYNMWK